MWSPASTVYWASKDAFTAYSHRRGSQRGTAWGMVGGDAPGEDTMLPLCCPEGSVGIRHQYRCWYKETIASLPGFGMAPEGHLSYSSGLHICTGRTQPCSVRVRIDPIPPKGLPRLPTCHRQRSSHTAAPMSDKPVHGVRTRLTGISSAGGRCTTWGISTCGVRGICLLYTSPS